ncbi:MAG: Gfo/Idh/MocA family oxidoreductase [Clostridia bacterium]|nr:Gfo/Idh/MocA family oxidoreductase [Clostridia bacterium]
MSRNKKPYVFQVSTKPDISSYKWINEEWSLLSMTLLWFIWACRFFSMYQHLKAIYRLLVERLGRSNTDNQSGRANIPPMMGEVYYLAWTALFVVAHIFGWDSLLLRGGAIYYLFESTVWILYYTIFRRFFEIGYSIYHQLEYLTAIFLIVPTQALCFAKLYGGDFRNMLAALLGADGEAIPFPVKVLGCVLSAIVISMIISTFPLEAIKKRDKRPCMFIIGCGDVVKERVYPVIRSSECASRVEVYDLAAQQSRVDYCQYLASPAAICGAIDSRMTNEDVVWIETPSFAHLSYLEHYIDSKVKLIVLEKPIAVDRQELQRVEAMIATDADRDKIFFLSYYVLEKALPLFFLTNNNERYRKYLDVEDESLADNWRFLLGRMEKAEVTIYEGEDNRDWVYDRQKGGQLLETFLHNVLIASLLCGRPEHWTEVACKESVQAGNMWEISATAKSGNTDIALYLKKNAPAEELRRTAVFTFSGGRLEADFDAKSLRIYFAALDKYSTIAVKRHFDRKYSVLTDMVSRVVEGECSTFEIDGLFNQIPCINWLLDLQETL